MKIPRYKVLKSAALVLIAAALFSPSAALAQASETRAQLQAYVTANIGPNGVGAITGTVLQRALLNQAASTGTLLDPNTFAQTQTFSGGVNITGGIVFAPSYTSTNPGNAGIYSDIANPPNGYAGIWNAIQLSQGIPVPATSQFGGENVPIQQGLVATLNVQSGDVAGNGGYAFSAYGRTFSTVTGAQGVGGFGLCAVEGAPICEGGNFGVSNGVIFNGSSFVGFDFGFASGQETDISFEKVTGGADPTGALFGAYYTGSGNLTGPLGTGVGVDVLSQATNAKWANGFETTAGAAVNGYVAGAATKGNSVGSQPFLMENTNGSGVTGFAEMLSDASADIVFIPAIGVGGVVAMQDGLGNTIAETTPNNFISNKAEIFANFAVAGILTNNSAGLLASVTTLPLSDLSAQSANTVVGNSTSGSASPTALSVGSCSTSSSGLIWTTNTGFGCNTGINAATLLTATWASPAAIGSTAPNSGSFTSLSRTGTEISAGTPPVGSTGACVASSFSGGATAGKFATASSCAGTNLVLSSMAATTTGYSCVALDQTTPTDTVVQTANSTTSATFKATTAAADVIVFNCIGW